VCPACASAPLVDNGPISSGPVRIADMDRKGFYVIACEYVCRSAVCVAAVAGSDDAAAANANGSGGGSGGRTFASTDSVIMRSLPQALQDDFPAFVHPARCTGSAREVWDWRTVGVSRALWALARSLVGRAKMGRQMLLQVLVAMQQGSGSGSGLGIGLGMGMGQGSLNVSGGRSERDEPWLREESRLLYLQQQQQQQPQQQQQQQQQQQEEEELFGMRRSSLDHGVQDSQSMQFFHHQQSQLHEQLHQHQQQASSAYASFMTSSSNQPGIFDQGSLGNALEVSIYL
jgi:hypothetical protein